MKKRKEAEGRGGRKGMEEEVGREKAKKKGTRKKGGKGEGRSEGRRKAEEEGVVLPNPGTGGSEKTLKFL
jgi:hypothetical protein